MNKGRAILGTALAIQINAIFISVLNVTDKSTDADY